MRATGGLGGQPAADGLRKRSPIGTRRKSRASLATRRPALLIHRRPPRNPLSFAATVPIVHTSRAINLEIYYVDTDDGLLLGAACFLRAGEPLRHVRPLAAHSAAFPFAFFFAGLTGFALVNVGGLVYTYVSEPMGGGITMLMAPTVGLFGGGVFGYRLGMRRRRRAPEGDA